MLFNMFDICLWCSVSGLRRALCMLGSADEDLAQRQEKHRLPSCTGGFSNEAEGAALGCLAQYATTTASV